MCQYSKHLGHKREQGIFYGVIKNMADKSLTSKVFKSNLHDVLKWVEIWGMYKLFELICKLQ